MAEKLIKVQDLEKGDLFETPGTGILTVKDIRFPDTGVNKGKIVVQGPLAWIGIYDRDKEVRCFSPRFDVADESDSDT